MSTDAPGRSSRPILLGILGGVLVASDLQGPTRACSPRPPEALPASIWILLAPNVRTEDLVSRLRTEFPAADIRTDACTLPPRTTR